MIVKMRKLEKDGLLELIEIIPNNLIFCEVGCYTGEGTNLFLNSGKIKKYYAVDPWVGNYSKNDLASMSDMKKAEKMFDKTVKGFNNIIKLKNKFENIYKELPELDMIYIDANHEYEFIKQDILNSIKIVKSGGIIAGHDYRKPNGVVKAVNEIFGKPLEIFSDTSWYVINN